MTSFPVLSDNRTTLKNWSIKLYSLIKRLNLTFDAEGRFVTNKDITIANTNTGLILTSPDGNKWRLKVDNSGVISTEIL